MIALDTNVVSEFMSEPASGRVQQWLDSQVSGDLWITSMSLAELRFGIERLPRGLKRETLGDVFQRVTIRLFGDRVLAFDRDCVSPYARIVAHRFSIGRPISVQDALIAAICLANDATLATRNIRDFEETGVTLINPWEV